MSKSDPDTSLLKLDKQVCFSLYRAANAMVRAYRPLLKELDITYLQYLALMVLWDEDGLSIGELGQQLSLDTGTLTPLIKRLESKGILRRIASTKDERVKHLHLTSRGKAMREQAESIPAQQLCRVNLNPKELLELKQLCDRLQIDDEN